VRDNTVGKRTQTLGIALIAALAMTLVAVPRSACADSQSVPSGTLQASFATDAGDSGQLFITPVQLDANLGFLGVWDFNVELDLLDSSGNITNQLLGVGIDWPLTVLPNGWVLHQIYFVVEDVSGNLFIHTGSYVSNPSFTTGGGGGLAEEIGVVNGFDWFFAF